jgi:hypothetical protein
MTNFDKTIKLLHGNINPYNDFDHTKYPDTLTPGSMPANELIQDVVRQLTPSFILEIGSWLGWSANGMATQMKLNGTTDGVIVCIDTWMGSPYDWNVRTETPDNTPVKLKNGYPTFYYNFLANMFYHELQNTVVPFAYPSVTAGEILKTVLNNPDIIIDMIYLDGSHIAQDVFNDCLTFYPLLKNKGVILGDDWNKVGVSYGITEFCNSENLPLPRIFPNGVHWIIEKP